MKDVKTISIGKGHLFVTPLKKWGDGMYSTDVDGIMSLTFVCAEFVKGLIGKAPSKIALTISDEEIPGGKKCFIQMGAPPLVSVYTSDRSVLGESYLVNLYWYSPDIKVTKNSFQGKVERPEEHDFLTHWRSRSLTGEMIDTFRGYFLEPHDCEDGTWLPVWVKIEEVEK